MSGTVGKYKVKMKLDVDYDTGKISGWYYYTSIGAKAKVALNGYGEFFNEDGAVLVETVNGKHTGTFVGTLVYSGFGGVSVYIYGGEWISPTGKKLTFEVNGVE